MTVLAHTEDMLSFACFPQNRLEKQRNTGLSLLTLSVASFGPLFSQAIVSLASKCVVSMRHSFGTSRPSHPKRLDLPFGS